MKTVDQSAKCTESAAPATAQTARSTGTGASSASASGCAAMGSAARDAVVREALDGYVNQTYRSLRYGTRLDAVEAVPPALRTIFALSNRVRPYNKYLEWELRHHPLEDWTAEELLPLISRVLTGEPAAQHELFNRLEAPARREGFGDVVDGWEPDVAWLRGEAGYREP